jgi:hypothetical protein
MDNFKFEPSSENVVWRLANIQMPWIEKDLSKGPTMPLKVSRLTREH